MTNMTVMAVYGKTLKNLFSQKPGIKTAFYKKHFGFIYYQFCSDDMIRDWPWHFYTVGDCWNSSPWISGIYRHVQKITDLKKNADQSVVWFLFCWKYLGFQNYALPLSTTIPLHRWMDDLQFNTLFISISVMSGPWMDDNERLCVMESYWSFSRFRFEQGSNPGR